MPDRSPLPTLFLSWSFKSSGLVDGGRGRRAGLKLAGLLSTVFIVANALVAAAAGAFCDASFIGRLNLWTSAAVSLAAFLAAYPVMRSVFGALYRHALFDGYGFMRKVGLASTCSAIAGLSAGALIVGHAAFAATTCGMDMPGLAGMSASITSGLVTAWLMILGPLALRVIPIEDMRVTGDYPTMFDLAARRRHGGSSPKARRLRPAPKGLPPVLSGLGGFARAQMRAAAARRLRLLLLLAAALVLCIFAYALAGRGNDMGAALSLCALAILAAEVLGVPELLLDKRIALSGQPFSRSLSLALAPHGRVLVVLAAGAGILLDMPREALIVFAGAALVIVTRFLMRLAWHGRAAAATRDGLVLAAAAAGLFTLLGPPGLLLLAGLPAFFYIIAKRRMERA